MITGIAQLADNDFGDNLGDGVAGPIGLLIIVLLVIATVFLIRNMNARLRRLPQSFPDPRDAARTAESSAEPPTKPPTEPPAEPPALAEGETAEADSGQIPR